MNAPLMQKTPGDLLDYDVDFSDWLVSGDTIIGAVATIEGGTATIPHTSLSTTSVKVWIEGGADAETAEIEVTVTTQGGREKKSCFRLRIKDC